MAEGEARRGIKRKASIPAIALCIKSQDGNKEFFKVGVDKVMKELLKTFAEKQKLEYRCVTLLLNGKRLRVKKTIAELGLKNGDEIDAMVIQTGGGPSSN